MLHCKCWWGLSPLLLSLSLEPQHSLSPTLVSYVDDRSSSLVRTSTTSLPPTTATSGQYFYRFSYYYYCYYWSILQLLPILTPWPSFMGVLGVSILTPMLHNSWAHSLAISLSLQLRNTNYFLNLTPGERRGDLLIWASGLPHNQYLCWFGHYVQTKATSSNADKQLLSLKGKAISVLSVGVGKGRCNKPPHA